jgi:hypothetical protein
MTSISTPVKIPLRERINFRLIIFLLVIGTPIVWVVYTFLQAELTHGIQDAGNGYKLVDLKKMSSFDLDQSTGKLSDVPPDMRQLDGKKVVLYGEIWAPDSASPELNHFDLCYSIAKCCFSGPPLVQHFVKSKTANGTVGYYSGLVKVKGTLHVNIIPGVEKIASVYQLDVESVEPVS